MMEKSWRFSFLLKLIVICCMFAGTICSPSKNATSSKLSKTVATNQQIKCFLEKQKVDMQKIEDMNVLKHYSDAFFRTDGAIHEYNSKLGKLNCLIKTNSATPQSVVVALHGYASNKDKLAMIADEFFKKHVYIPTTFVIPDAPLVLNAEKKEYAWWNFPIGDLEHILSPSEIDKMLNFQPDGLQSATTDIIEMIEAASTEFAVPTEYFVLFGFSQGAAQVLDVMMNMKKFPYLVGSFGGGPLMQDQWRDVMFEMDENRKKQLKKVSIFQSHGLRDTIVPYYAAMMVKIFLEDLDFLFEFDETAGGHDIALSSLDKFYWKISNMHPNYGWTSK